VVVLGVNHAIAKQAGYPVKKKDIKVIPEWVGILMAFFAEWFVWIVSFGRRESNLTRFGVRYSCISRTLNIEKAQRVLGYQPIYLMNERLRGLCGGILSRRRRICSRLLTLNFGFDLPN